MAIWPVAALRNGLSTSTRTQFGSPAAYDNLTALSILMLVRTRTANDDRVLLGKGVSLTNWSLRLFGTGGAVEFVWGAATTDLTYTTNETPLRPPTNALGRNGWRWIACTVDQAATAGDLVRIYYSYLGARGTPPTWTTATFATATDGAGGYDDDNASNLVMGGTTSATNAYQGDIAMVFLANSRLPLATLTQVAMRPMDFRSQALLLAFPGENGARYVRNHSTKLSQHGAISTAVPCNGPPWAPWAAPDDDLYADAAAVTSSLLLRRRRAAWR